MLKSLSSNNRTAFDFVNIVAGLGLLLSPWYLGYATEAYAAWNAWIVGAAVALIAVAALSAFHQVEEWANAALGLWAVIAPWVLGFSAVTFATWAHVIAGLVVAVLAAVSLWFTTNRPLSTA
ncbi:SPW repeat protein [Aureimonas sp. OT7]|uniref:SPW repeat protein n=1 Tax=Aureimonas sp. OT7 TaxID=2816454 RepID=UPI00177FACFE|nr:SPW repeat protein [Aureimonas sp. OT7]QOG06578.1 SPW repeat protein [Aureimonas sp. OT7]QOG07209.1 SPW repeat protein [Aureimonas sp. OT7]